MNCRAMAVILLFCGLVVFLLSSALVYIAPPGGPWEREWRALFLSKGDWEAISIIFELLLILTVVGYAIVNRCSLKVFAKTHLSLTGIKAFFSSFKFEILAALAVVVVLFGATVSKAIPAAYIFDGRDAVARVFKFTNPDMPGSPEEFRRMHEERMMRMRDAAPPPPPIPAGGPDAKAAPMKVPPMMAPGKAPPPPMMAPPPAAAPPLAVPPKAPAPAVKAGAPVPPPVEAVKPEKK